MMSLRKSARVGVIGIACGAAVALGADDPVKPVPQPAPAPTPPPAQTPPPTPTPAPTTPPAQDQPGAEAGKTGAGTAADPSLDELLGLDRPTDRAVGPEDRGIDKELERRLSAAEMGDVFQQALTLMNDAADKMENRDVGIATQRVQEDVLKRLDQLIDQMEKNSQQQQQSGSSSQQQGRQQNPSQSQQQSSRKGGSKKGQQPGEPQAGSGENTSGRAPGLQQGALRPALESAPAAWGSLPARVRDMLLQGAGDKFSATWDKATENYYRRLAEEQTKP